MGDNTFEALKDINIHVEESEVVAIIGPSGSGKSTTMNIIGLLDRQTSGQYFLNGSEVKKLKSNELATLRNKSIGFIFQSFFLLPKLTALQNVALPLVYRGVSKKERNTRALEMLKKVDMADHAHHKPFELSGGQQQRVAIARALVGEPAIILADEPTGALDSKTSQDVLNLLLDLNRNLSSTVVIITHDMDVANQCPRIIHIHDGNIVDKPPEESEGQQ